MYLSSLPIIFFITLHDFLDHAGVFQTVHDSSLFRLFFVSRDFYFDIVIISYVIRCRVISFYHV